MYIKKYIYKNFIKKNNINKNLILKIIYKIKLFYKK